MWEMERVAVLERERERGIDVSFKFREIQRERKVAMPYNYHFVFFIPYNNRTRGNVTTPRQNFFINTEDS